MKWFVSLIITLLVFVVTTNSQADEVYFLNKMSSCTIEMFKDKKLQTVSPIPFSNVVLNVRSIPSKPDYVAFKQNNIIFITKQICVVSTDVYNDDNHLMGNEYKKRVEITEKDKFNSYKYFIEFDTGFINVLDNNSVGGDYNEIIPSDSTNPTQWSEAASSDYKAASLISLGFGFKTYKNRFLAFKIRLLNGTKSDALDLVDLNTSLSEPGAWTYEDTFKNFYGGYKFIFRDYSEWKPILAVYLGVSQMNSTMSDGDVHYELSSIGIAALVEAGIEYHINSNVGLGMNLGLEYLGNRSMKFVDKTSGNEFKTKMSYTNQYLSLGIKYYF
jgi:hypothetical protein